MTLPGTLAPPQVFPVVSEKCVKKIRRCANRYPLRISSRSIFAHTTHWHSHLLTGQTMSTDLPSVCATDAETLTQVHDIARDHLRTIVHAETADDLAQDVVLACLLRMRRGTWRVAPRTLAPHVRRIARLRAVDLLRRAQSRAMRNAEHSRELAEGTHAWMNPDLGVEQQELAALESSVLNQLSAASRLVFVMVRQNGLSYEAVAEALGISRSAVCRSMVRAQKKIRQALDKQEIVAPPKGKRRGGSQGPRPI